MSTRVDHGPPGSYKTFTIVQRFAIPALLQGRVVITNVRGLTSLDLVKEQFPTVEFPPTSRLIFLDTTDEHTGKEARLYFACWYKWIPLGALLIIDEAQTIYPDRTDFKLESLDKVEIPPDFFPVDNVNEARPLDVFTAFDKHRHYGWDIFLTTTNIAKIKRDIREASEWAYRHRSLSDVSPFHKDTWYEHQHDPENNGKAESHRVGKPRKYKADKRIFKCYQSTATGEHKGSAAGTTMFSDSGIRTKLAAIVIAVFAFVGFFIYKLNQKPLTLEQAAGISNASASIDKPSVSVAPVVSVQNTTKADNTFNNPLATVKVSTASTNVNLSDIWRISGVISNPKTHKFAVFASDNNGHYRRLSGCKFDNFNEPTCLVDGQIVTSYSGSIIQKPKNNIKLTRSN
jgi:zona occludens toxin